jgi:hypothetical protein
MATRKSFEAKVLEHFRTAPLANVELLYGLIRDEVKRRASNTLEPGTGTVRKQRKPRKARAAVAPADGGGSYEESAMKQFSSRSEQ